MSEKPCKLLILLGVRSLPEKTAQKRSAAQPAS